jgi:Protein of unknown function (DUF3108)
MPGRFHPRLICACLAFLAMPSSQSQSKLEVRENPAFPAKEVLSYAVEWRLIYAGDARLTLEPMHVDGESVDGKTRWESKLQVESGGLVSKLFKLEDKYEVAMEEPFCTTATHLDALEGKRHHDVRVTYDYSRGKAKSVERDLVKNVISKTSEADIPRCITDILGGLYKLRTLRLEPGQSTQVMLSDGKKTVSARVEAQEREQLKTMAGTFNTVRYEVFVFNGVLYARKAQLQVWLSDDARALPVQIRARMNFPVGSITFQLAKDESP